MSVVFLGLLLGLLLGPSVPQLFRYCDVRGGTVASQTSHFSEPAFLYLALFPLVLSPPIRERVSAFRSL